MTDMYLFNSIIKANKSDIHLVDRKYDKIKYHFNTFLFILLKMGWFDSKLFMIKL